MYTSGDQVSSRQRTPLRQIGATVLFVLFAVPQLLAIMLGTGALLALLVYGVCSAHLAGCSPCSIIRTGMLVVWLTVLLLACGLLVAVGLTDIWGKRPEPDARAH